jgi:hypothetical protein
LEEVESKKREKQATELAAIDAAQALVLSGDFDASDEE